MTPSPEQQVERLLEDVYERIDSKQAFVMELSKQLETEQMKTWGPSDPNGVVITGQTWETTVEFPRATVNLEVEYDRPSDAPDIDVD